MKKTFLRFVSAALATMMLFGCINVGVFAADGQNNVTTVTTTPSVTTQEGADNTPSVMAIVQNKSIASIIAGSKIPGGFTAEEKAVLNAIALKSESLSYTEIGVDAGENVQLAITEVANTYDVKANTVASGLAAVWTPVGGRAVCENGTVEFALTNGEGSFVAEDIDHVEIDYELTVSEISAETVGFVANLPYVLAGEAVAQKDVLDYYAQDKIYNNLLNFATFLPLLSFLKGSFGVEAQVQIDKLMAECIHSTNDGQTLYFAEYIAEYRAKGLAYYYAEGSYEAISSQLNLVKEAINVISEDAKFNEIFTPGSVVDQMMPSYDIPGKKKGIDEVREALNAKVLVPVNANIDRSSAYLPALATAIEAAIGNSAEHADSALVLGKTVNAAAPDKTYVNITVSVVTKDNVVIDTLNGGKTFKINSVVSPDDALALEGIVASLEADLGIDTENYTCTSIGDDLPVEGDTIASKVDVSFVWAPISYTVIIEGAEDQVLYGDGSGLTIVLPGTGDIAAKYIYSIAGDEITVGVENRNYTFSDISVLKEICEDGKVTLKRTVLNAAREDILDFIDAMNEAMADKATVVVNGQKVPVVSFIPVESVGGEISVILRVTPYLQGVDYQGLVLDIMKVLTVDGNPFGTLKINGNTLYNGKVYVQTVLDTVLSDNFGLDAICNMIDANGDIKDIKETELPGVTVIDTEYQVALSDKLGGKLISAELQADGFKFPFYITFEDYDQMADTLIKVEKALLTVKDNIAISGENGVLNVEIVMPASFSAYYLAELLVMDQAELSDIENMDLEEALAFMTSLIKPLVADSNLTLETIENTAAKAGKNVDLSKYVTEARFAQIRKALNFLFTKGTLESEMIGDTYSAIVSYEIRDILVNKFHVDSMFLDLIAEAAEDSKGISLNFTITDNTIVESDFDALIVNPNDKSLGLLTTTKDLASVLNKAPANTIVVLLQDVTLSSDVVIPNNTFINLNGYTITGNMKSAANVRITDSNLSGECGGVNGELTGNFVITGGRYTTDVASMLKKGYEVAADGCVVNKLFTASIDADGNTVIAVKGDAFSFENLPTNAIKDFALDLAFDIALNMFTSASTTVNGHTLYSVELNDIIGMLDESLNDIANTAMGCISYEGLTGLANDVLAVLSDFGAMADALVTGEALATYEIVTKAWDISSAITGGTDKYITLNVVPSEETETKTLSIVFDPDMADEDVSALTDLFENLDKTVDFGASVVINGIDIFKRPISIDSIDMSGVINVNVNFASDIRYSVFVLAAVAYSVPAQRDALLTAINAYLTDGDLEAVAAALDTITSAQLITAMKTIASTDCEEMLSAIGVDNEGIVELEAIYADLLDIAGKIVAKLGVKGGSAALGSYKVENTMAKYAFDSEDVYGFAVYFSIVMLDENTSVEPQIVDVKMETNDNIFANHIANGFIYIDAHHTGLSADDIDATLQITTKHADEKGWKIVKGAESTSADRLCTGDIIVVKAERANNTVSVSYIVVILGDTNCNGLIDAGDAVRMAKHYVGLEEMDAFSGLAADTNRNNGVDAGDAVKVTGKYIDCNNYTSVLGQ